uniref:Integrase catalytic domain-containing protein n=1 Tax=Bursaphelenchus xylophilus TaxID=6326 RepID=A0A1I7SGB8_BURXY
MTSFDIKFPSLINRNPRYFSPYFGTYKTISLQHTLRSETTDFFSDESGIIRWKTRRLIAGSTTLTHNPPYLPPDSPILDSYILHLHIRHMHASPEYVFSLLRELVFIPKARSIVKRILKTCQHCKNLKAKPYEQPPFPPFPPQRTTPSPPFSYCGVDFLGPAQVKDHDGSVIKVYAVIFCCLSTRCIYLDLARDMSAKSFLFALRRFSARRGFPVQLYSDNGPNLTAVASLLDRNSITGEIILNSKVAEFLRSQQLTWKFSPSFSPFSNGWFERLIGIVKSSLNRVIGRRLLDIEEYQTLLTESEYIVNCRPITYSSSEESPVIRPADFLNLSVIRPPYPLSPDDHNDPDWILPADENLAKTQLLNQWKNSNTLTDRLWHYWTSSYLTELQARNKTQHRQETPSTLSPQVNEIVLIKEQQMPRHMWRLGRITKLHSTPYRSASLTTVSASGQKRKITRPISKLCPLELRALASVVCLFALVFQFAQGCSETQTIIGSSETCSKYSDDKIVCNFKKSLVFSVRPQSKFICLQISSTFGNDTAYANLIISAQSLNYVCTPSTVTFTRPFKIHVEKSHRCDAAAGSQCQASFCESVTSTTNLIDFGSEANSLPGHSRCSRSCGCISCGCFLCSPSCLFYRYYASPVSDDILHAFTCASYDTYLRGTLALDHNQTQFTLQHGQQFDWENISLSILSSSYSPTPILGYIFLTSMKTNKTVALNPALVSTYNNLLKFSCPSIQSARQFRCEFPSSLCQCSPDFFSPRCNCADIDFSSLFESRDFAFPFSREGISMEMEGERPTAKSNHATELIVSLDRNVTLLFHRSKCECVLSSVTGCFNCQQSPMVNLKCQASFGITTAVIICKSVQVQPFLCPPQRSSLMMPFPSRTQEFDEECVVKCAGGNTTLRIHGSLNASKPLNPAPEGGEIAKDKTPSSSWSEVWSTIFNFLKDLKWYYFVILAGGLAFLILLIVVYISPFARECLRRTRIEALSPIMPRPQHTLQ